MAPRGALRQSRPGRLRRAARPADRSAWSATRRWSRSTAT